jgi:hypothetical protein
MSRGLLFVLLSKSLEVSPITSPNVTSSKESSVYLQNVVSKWSTDHTTNSSFRLLFLLRTYTNTFNTGDARLRVVQAIDPHIWGNGQSCLQWVDPRFHLLFIQLNFLLCLSDAMRIVRPIESQKEAEVRLHFIKSWNQFGVCVKRYSMDSDIVMFGIMGPLGVTDVS